MSVDTHAVTIWYQVSPETAMGRVHSVEMFLELP